MARMIKAGIYNKLIVIQKPIYSASNYGATKNSWEDVTTVRASVEPIQGREYFSGPFQLSEQIVRVRIRYIDGITNKMRLKYAGKFYEIFSVIDSKESHRELQLMCKQGEAYGQR